MPTVAPLVLDDSAQVALLGAELVTNRLHARPGLRLLLPTGRTPEGMYAALRSRAADGSRSTEQATVFQLDEYAGLSPGDERSFAAALTRNLTGLQFRKVELLDGSAPPEAESERYQRLLDEGPIDLAVLGLGRDGHVAFDEPGSTSDSGTRRVALTEGTRADAIDQFGSLEAVPTAAITIGMRTLLAARAVMVLVTGAAKAPALKAMLEGPQGPGTPASLLRGHPRLKVICDRAAAAELRPRQNWGSDRALVILGHRKPGVDSEHVASEESFARLRHAERLVARSSVRACVLTGWTRSHGLSEAEQMLTAWKQPDVPAVLEVAGRNTAENASRSLPLLLAMGAIRHVTVVTSAFHFRSRWFFAPYRRYGLRVDHAPVFTAAGWRLIPGELRQLPAAPRARRESYAAVRLPPAPG